MLLLPWPVCQVFIEVFCLHDRHQVRDQLEFQVGLMLLLLMIVALDILGVSLYVSSKAIASNSPLITSLFLLIHGACNNRISKPRAPHIGMSAHW